MSADVVALGALIVETRMLFRALRGAAERVHGGDSQTAARRSILVELVDEGPRTVPAMSEARHVSRQAVQGLVNALAADGLIEQVANPAHKRSWLWRATRRGVDAVVRLRARETRALSLLDAPDPERLREASAVLAEVRRLLDALDG